MWLKELQVEVKPGLQWHPWKQGVGPHCSRKRAPAVLLLKESRTALCSRNRAQPPATKAFFAVSHFSCVDRACQQAGERPDCTATAPEK